MIWPRLDGIYDVPFTCNGCPPALVALTSKKYVLLPALRAFDNISCSLSYMLIFLRLILIVKNEKNI